MTRVAKQLQSCRKFDTSAIFNPPFDLSNSRPVFRDCRQVLDYKVNPWFCQTWIDFLDEKSFTSCMVQNFWNNNLQWAFICTGSLKIWCNSYWKTPVSNWPQATQGNQNRVCARLFCSWNTCVFFACFLTTLVCVRYFCFDFWHVCWLFPLSFFAYWIWRKCHCRTLATWHWILADTKFHSTNCSKIETTIWLAVVANAFCFKFLRIFSQIPRGFHKVFSEVAESSNNVRWPLRF